MAPNDWDDDYGYYIGPDAEAPKEEKPCEKCRLSSDEYFKKPGMLWCCWSGCYVDSQYTCDYFKNWALDGSKTYS